LEEVQTGKSANVAAFCPLLSCAPAKAKIGPPRERDKFVTAERKQDATLANAQRFHSPSRIFMGFLLNGPFLGRHCEAPMNDMKFTTESKALIGKILLAEDDNDMRRFLGKALQNAGFNVASFDNGLAAYQRLREEPFELLLTDIVMPEMDGIELARRATELDPDIKVMFITGFAAVALNPDNNAPPQAKILSKPFHLKDLVNEVQRMLAAA
jgi:two-component system, cell cycle response regulator CpdR